MPPPRTPPLTHPLHPTSNPPTPLSHTLTHTPCTPLLRPPPAPPSYAPSQITALAWHPVHAELFVSGGFDGTIYFWSSQHPEPLEVAVGSHGWQATIYPPFPPPPPSFPGHA